MRRVCAALGCDVICRRKRVFCRRHWDTIPRHIQVNLCDSYVQGQFSDDGLIRAEWMLALVRAVNIIAIRDGFSTPEEAAAREDSIRQLYKRGENQP